MNKREQVALRSLAQGWHDKMKENFVTTDQAAVFGACSVDLAEVVDDLAAPTPLVYGDGVQVCHNLGCGVLTFSGLVCPGCGYHA